MKNDGHRNRLVVLLLIVLEFFTLCTTGKAGSQSERWRGWVAFFSSQKDGKTLYADIGLSVNLRFVRGLPDRGGAPLTIRNVGGEWVSSSQLVFIADAFDPATKSIIEDQGLKEGAASESATLGELDVAALPKMHKCYLCGGSGLTEVGSSTLILPFDACYTKPGDNTVLVLRARTGKLRTFWREDVGREENPMVWEIPSSWEPLITELAPTVDHPKGGFEINLEAPLDERAIEFGFMLKEMRGQFPGQQVIVPVFKPLGTKASDIPLGETSQFPVITSRTTVVGVVPMCLVKTEVAAQENANKTAENLTAILAKEKSFHVLMLC